VKLISRSGEEVTARYPEVHAMGRALGSRQVTLDGRGSCPGTHRDAPALSRSSSGWAITSETDVRRKMKVVPSTYMIFDLIWQDAPLVVPVWDTRSRGAGLPRSSFPARLQTPPFEKGGGQAMLDATRGAVGRRHGQEADSPLRARTTGAEPG